MTVAQQGTRVVLTFPIVRTPRSPKLQRIDVYRLIESATEPMGLPPESFSTQATVIATVPAENLPLNRSTITYPDQLDLKTRSITVRYRYAVRLVTAAGIAADFSNYAIITPLFDLALPPGDVQATQRETEIELTWSPPVANEGGSTPANIAAYNIYRREGESAQPPVKLNAEPLRATRFIDRSFQFGAKYEYLIRGLSLLPNDASLINAIETNESAPLADNPKDTFPPAAPTPITIASIASIVSLYWPLNAEADVVGYNIYRAESEATPPAQFTKLNPQLHKTASFRDERVQAGKKYFYQIAAVDASGNESPRSETAAEVVAP